MSSVHFVVASGVWKVPAPCWVAVTRSAWAAWKRRYAPARGIFGTYFAPFVVFQLRFRWTAWGICLGASLKRLKLTTFSAATMPLSGVTMLCTASRASKFVLHWRNSTFKYWFITSAIYFLYDLVAEYFYYSFTQINYIPNTRLVPNPYMSRKPLR